MEKEVIIFYGMDIGSSDDDCTVYGKWDGEKIEIITEEEYKCLARED